MTWHNYNLTEQTKAPITKNMAYGLSYTNNQHIVYSNENGKIQQLNWDNEWSHIDLSEEMDGTQSVGDVNEAFFYNETPTKRLMQFIMYRTADNHIHVLVNDSGWNHLDLTEKYDCPLAASELTHFITPVSLNIFYRGTDDKLHQINFYDNRWYLNDDPTLLNAPTPADNPSAYYFPYQKSSHIIYRGKDDDHLYELYEGVERGWKVNALTETSGAPLPASNLSTYIDGETQNIVYSDKEGFINHMRWIGTGWIHTNLTELSHAPPAKNSPVGIGIPETDYQYVSFQGSEGNLYVMAHISGMNIKGKPFWILVDLTEELNMLPTEGDITIYKAYNYPHIIWRDKSGNIFDTNAVPKPLNETELNDVVKKYAPQLYFYPNETYLSSSIEWFLERATLHDGKTGHNIKHPKVSQLPDGNQGEDRFWLTIPDSAESGDLSTARAYVNAKFDRETDSTYIQYWFFYPYNGPGTAHISINSFEKDFALNAGAHYGDWEHITIQVDNDSKDLKSVYMSQHSGGQWFKGKDLNKLERKGDQIVVYASHNGHASYPTQGHNPTAKFEVSIPLVIKTYYFVFYLINETSKGKSLDCSQNFDIVSANFLGASKPIEPRWLNYAYPWGPVRVVNTGEIEREIENALHLGFPWNKVLHLVFETTHLIDWIMGKLELSKTGPIGPKQKDSWNKPWSET